MVGEQNYWHFEQPKYEQPSECDLFQVQEKFLKTDEQFGKR